MSKNTISTFSLILLIVAVMWFFHMNRLAEREAAQDIQALEQESIAAEREPETRNTPTRGSSPARPAAGVPQSSLRASQLSGELQNLEQQLATAEESLQMQRQTFQQLQSQNQSVVARIPASATSNSANLLRSEAEVQNALLEIDSYRNLETQISRQAEDQTRLQNSAAQAQLSQLDESVRVQQSLLQQTREDIAYWSMNYNDLTRQQAELQRLQDQQNLQTEQLNLMLQQRLLIAAEALSTAQAIEAQKQQALADVRENQAAAQGDIETLRDSIIRLQQSQREIRSSQISLSSQLRQAQQNLQSQEAQVRTLESAVQQKRQELDSLVR